MQTRNVFVDSICGDYCRLLLTPGGIQMDMPLEVMPAGTSEGDWFSLTIEPRPELRTKKTEEIDAILKKLGNEI